MNFLIKKTTLSSLLLISVANIGNTEIPSPPNQTNLNSIEVQNNQTVSKPAPHSWNPSREIWDKSVRLAQKANEQYKNSNRDGLSDEDLWEQTKIDAVLWYNTMFTNTSKQIQLNQILNDGKMSERRLKTKTFNQPLKENFVKRLFLFSILGDFRYISNANGEHSKNQLTPPVAINWPFPISLIYSHGTRVLVKIGGNRISSENLFNWLTTGDLTVEPLYTHLRMISTHGTRKEGDCSQLQNSNCIIEELKQTSVTGILQSGSEGLNSKHRYINVALGGLGYPDYFGNLISYNGHRLKSMNTKSNIPSYVLDESVQHGHVYIYLGPSSMLIGVEPSAPGKHDMFEQSHDFTSGFKNSTELPSPTGGAKMQKLLGSRAPRQYNGMMIHVEDQQFENINQKVNFILEQPNYKQALLFQKILLQSIQEARESIAAFVHENSVKQQ